MNSYFLCPVQAERNMRILFMTMSRIIRKKFMEAVRYLREKGYPTVELSEEELHMLLSAYLTACFEPIIHDYDDVKIEKYLNTVQKFFMPGWLKIMGVK